jgi:hypothetical protein
VRKWGADEAALRAMKTRLLQMAFSVGLTLVVAVTLAWA